MKKLTTLIVIAIMVLCSILICSKSVYADDKVVGSGSCGTNLTWTLTGVDNDLTLTISGYGQLSYYRNTSDLPWYGRRESISHVFIEEGLTNVRAWMFRGCTNLKTAVIPKSVQSIGIEVFKDCNNIESISIPFIGVSNEDNPKELGEIFGEKGSFGSVNGHVPTSLKTVEITNAEEIPDGAFQWTHVETVVLSDTISRIGDSAFSYCNKLSSINIPDSVTSIGNSAFYQCTNLQSISIPDSVTTIGNSAFYQCINLQSVSIPDSVMTIGDSTFYKCTNLQSVTIPDSVTKISSLAFSNNLKSIFISNSVKTINAQAIGSNTTIYTIPGSAADEYAQNNGNTVKYLCDELQSNSKDVLAFTTETISMLPLSSINLSDYLATNFDILDCTVKVSNNSAFVYDDGTIVNLGEGECVITVSVDDLSASVKVIATEDIAEIQSLSFKQDYITMNKGSITTNPIIINPENASVDDVIWFSSDKSVVSVENGFLKAKGTGDVVITAKSKNDDSIYATFNISVIQPLRVIAGIPDMSIEINQQAQFIYYTIPRDTTDAVSFSTDSDIISVDKDGVITAFKPGQADITISGGKVSKTFNINVTSKATGISILPKAVSVERTKTAQLEVVFEPEDTTQRDVVWSSNKESVATVDQNGLVTAHGKGIAVITATLGDLTANCNVVCPEVALESIYIDNSHNMIIGDKYSLGVEYTPKTTTDDLTVTWDSSDENVATISEDGIVTAVGAGGAVITASVGECSATCNIDVAKKDPKYTVPETLYGFCEQPLSDFTLPKGFAWEDPNETIGSAGTKNFKAYYTPEDTDIYNVIHNIDIEIEVGHYGWRTDEKSHWKTCACGFEEIRTSHTFGEWKVLAEPTATSEGEKERKCTVCGYTEKETIPELIIEISTPAELNAVRNNRDANYKLVKDIDMTAATASGGAYYNNGKGWTPISTFTGVFDGDGHSIIGLKTSQGSSHAGLFTQNNGTIKNLTLKDGRTGGESLYASSICAINNGTIESCKNYNSVSSMGYNAAMAGGITAFNHGKIIDSCNYGSIQVISILQNNLGTIVYVGGITGENDSENNTPINGCENHGHVSAITTKATAYAGGISGYNSAYGSQVSDSLNKGSVEAMSLKSYAINASYAGGITGWTNASIDSSTNEGMVNSMGEKGITNQSGGICGQANGTKNISIDKCMNYGSIIAAAEDHTQGASAGGIAGVASDRTTVSDSANEGLITAISEKHAYAGGIAGQIGGTINNCINDNLVGTNCKGTGSYIVLSGGIAGFLTTSGSKIHQSSNWGTVSSFGIGNNYAASGGICGISNEETSISQCYTKSNVMSYGLIGGIVGINAGTIKDSFNASNIITSEDHNENIPFYGGIAGANNDTGFISNVYTVGTFEGDYGIGGLGVGKDLSTKTQGKIVICDTWAIPAEGYKWLKFGDTYDYREMEDKSIYSGFDFNNVWEMGTGDYKLPVLKKCAGANAQTNIKIPLTGVYFDLLKTSYTYVGLPIMPREFIDYYISGMELGRDFEVSFKDNLNVGTATMTITGIAPFKGSVTREFRIVKANNPMSVQTKRQTVKFKKLKKKTQSIKANKAFIIKKAQGKVTYKVITYDKKAKKKITVSKTGKVKVKKGLKKGTYKLIVKVKDSGNRNYMPSSWKKVTLKIKVK